MLLKLITEFNLLQKNPLSFRYEISEGFTRESYWTEKASEHFSIQQDVKKYPIDSNKISEIVEHIKNHPGKIIEEKDLGLGQWSYIKEIDSFLVFISIDGNKTHHIAFTDISYKYIPWKNVRDLFIKRQPFIINDKLIIELSYPENINKESNLTRKQLKDLGKYLMSINKEFIIQGRQIKDTKSRHLMILKSLSDDVLLLELDQGTIQIEYISK